MSSFIGSVISELCKTTKHAFNNSLHCFHITWEGSKLPEFKGIKFRNKKVKIWDVYPEPEHS